MELWSFTVVPPPPQEIQNRGRGIQSSFRWVEHELLGTRALAIATMETKETRQATNSLDALSTSSFGFSTTLERRRKGSPLLVKPVLIQGK